MKEKIASFSNYLAALLVLVFGIIYLSKTSFMPYHSEAVSLEWSEIAQKFHFLILALMKAAGGGFVAAAISIFGLQYYYGRNRLKWIPILILCVGVVISLTSIYATMVIRLNTPGNPPTAAAAVGLILIIIGFIFNRD